MAIGATESGLSNLEDDLSAMGQPIADLGGRSRWVDRNPEWTPLVGRQCGLRQLAGLTMVQAAHERQFNDFAVVGRFDSTRLRAVLSQRPVRTMAMIDSSGTP
jgi:hypothetical protein